MLTSVVLVLVGMVGLFLLLSLFLPGFAGGVWSPTPPDVMHAMLRLASVQPNEHLVDLGYGDGRFLLTAAKRYGLQVTGYEINPIWEFWVRWKARLHSLHDRIELRRSSIFSADLTAADVVVMFLSQAANDRMAPLLRSQLRPGARVVTYQRTLPGWTASAEQEVRPGKSIYLYRQAPAAAGTPAAAQPPADDEWKA